MITDFTEQIKHVLDTNDPDKIFELFYKLEDDTIVGDTELGAIIGTCYYFGIDPIPYLEGKRDTILIRCLQEKLEADRYVGTLPEVTKVPKKSTKKESKKEGNVVTFKPKSTENE